MNTNSFFSENQQEINSPNSHKKTIFILVGIVFILVISVSSYMLGKKSLPTVSIRNYNIPSPTTYRQSVLSKDLEYQLSGSEVIRMVNGQKSILFKNISNVSEIRLGPDGRTFHFKINNFNSQTSQEFCADLESKLDLLPPNYSNPPPQQAPWDYQRIAHFGTINRCNTYNAGGYLKNSDYFAYLKLTSPTQGQLYYENLKTGELKQILVKSELLTGFNDATPGQANSYSVGSIVGKDSSQYFYPQQDSYLQNKYLVLALGRLVVAMDVQKK